MLYPEIEKFTEVYSVAPEHMPVLYNFVDICYAAKRHIYPYETAKRFELSSFDKKLIIRSKNAYTGSIQFGTNELCENIADKDSLIATISAFTNFCIKPYKYQKRKSKTKKSKITTLCDFGCEV